MTMTGALRFGRYSFPPNRLGYCGPPDHAALLEYVSSGQADPGLVDLERRFEGAYPYLVLIAEANDIHDPFDDRVVEAYWLGNHYLDQVGEKDFYEFLGAKFAPKMRADDFRWLSSKVGLGAHPHHNFHVFDVYTRAGLMGDNKAVLGLSVMDSCRISWARVSSIEGDQLVVARPNLELIEGKLAMSEPKTTRVTRQVDRRGFVQQVEPGDYVSVHWDWACEVLSLPALRRLTSLTAYYLELANKTL